MGKAVLTLWPGSEGVIPMVGTRGHVEREGNAMARGKGEIWGSGNLWVTLPGAPNPQLPQPGCRAVRGLKG